MYVHVYTYNVFCRDSIIPVSSSGGGGVRSEGDYDNVDLSLPDEDRSRLITVTGKEEALYTNPELAVAALNLEVKGHKKNVSSLHYSVL